MKTKWSALFSLTLLFTLASCGAEQFGTVPQSNTSNPDPIRVYEQLSCSSHTLIKPKVDILYVFDNTQSYHFSDSSVKQAVANTINQVSGEFDYRVISTTLVNPEGDTTPFDDYRVMTNSETTLPDPGKRVITSSELTNFFPLINEYHVERGLGRVHEFMDYHKNSNLLRKGAYHFVVLISNAFDKNIEQGDGTVTSPVPGAWDLITPKYASLKTGLQSKQLRLFSLTAKSRCKEGWRPSTHSYIKMANHLYSLSGATDNQTAKDSYDLCSTSDVGTVFNAVNASIQKVVVPHKYKYWPITFADNNVSILNDLAGIQVFKSNGSSQPVEMPAGTSFEYYDHGPAGAPLNILTTTDPSETVSGRRHFVRFKTGYEPVYPDCIQVKSASKVEYFGYIVLPREPVANSIHVTINGNAIPTSAWAYRGNITVQNIKKPHPSSPGGEIPAIPRTGFMIEILTPTPHPNADLDKYLYYKSGDNVQVNYLPAAI